MRTDQPTHAPALRPLRGYLARITGRADAEARAAGLTVEVLPGGVRRYRDPRLDQLAADRAADTSPYPSVRRVDVGEAAAWSTPTSP